MAHFVSLKIGMLVQQFGRNVEVIPEGGCSEYFCVHLRKYHDSGDKNSTPIHSIGVINVWAYFCDADTT